MIIKYVCCMHVVYAEFLYYYIFNSKILSLYNSYCNKLSLVL